MPRKIFNSPVELEENIKGYLEYAKKEDITPSISGLAWYLDTNTKSLNNYKNSVFTKQLKTVCDEDKEEYNFILEKYITYIESCLNENCMYKNSTIGSIFLLKNHFNYKDKQEIENTNLNVNNNLENLSLDELKDMMFKKD